MRNRTLLVRIMILLACSLRCSFESFSGGSGSEAGEATGKVVLALFQEPVQRAQVIVYPRPDSVFAVPRPAETLFTNAGGCFTLHLKPGQYSVEIRKDVYSTYRQGIVIVDKQHDSIGTIHIDSSVTVRGSIRSSDMLPFALHALGTPYLAEPGDDGTFTFKNVPQGKVTLIARYFIAGSNQYSLGKSVLFSNASGGVLDTIATSSNDLLLDDFDDGDTCNNLRAVLGGSVWRCNTDGISTIFPQTGNFADSLVQGRGGKGKCLHAAFALDSSATPKWVQIVTTIGTTSIDASGLDTLSFWAKGDGQVKIELALYENPGVFKSVYTIVTMTPVWTLYKVVPANFENAVDCTGWPGLKTTVNRVIFSMISGTDFWLDEIRLTGLSFNAITHK